MATPTRLHRRERAARFRLADTVPDTIAVLRPLVRRCDEVSKQRGMGGERAARTLATFSEGAGRSPLWGRGSDRRGGAGGGAGGVLMVDGLGPSAFGVADATSTRLDRFT